MATISAFVFDLDGTLVQTERLKAESYAKAAVELCSSDVTEAEVIEAYKSVVGESRKTVATTLMKQFGLETPSAERMAGVDVDTPWQAFAQVASAIYEDLLDTVDARLAEGAAAEPIVPRKPGPMARGTPGTRVIFTPTHT